VSEAPIGTRAMTDADVPAVVDLLNEALGPAPGGVDRGALFEWKHLRNPAGRSIALVAELDGSIVGLRSFMRWTLEGANGERVTAVRAVDTATSPSVQRRGIFSRLTTEGLERCRDEGVRFVFNTPNDKSRPGYLKMGWHVVARWPIWTKVRRPDRLLVAAARRDLASGPGVQVSAGSSARPVSEVLDAAGAIAAAAGAPRRGLHTPCTKDHLRWRYAEGPMVYHAVVGEGALVVVRLRARGRLREAVVCEAMARAGAERELRQMLRDVPADTGADHAVAHLGSGWPGRASLNGAGYHRLPRVGMVFTVRRLDESEPDPLDRSNWALTLGDLEVF
jgi:predicted N-acetyltransferase YhbS